MREFKGTKGNWQSDLNHAFANIDNSELCCIWGDGETVKGSELIAHIDKSPGLEKAKANMKLIECAPQLLKMVVLLVDRLEESDLGHLSAVRRAKELIKKANEL